MSEILTAQELADHCHVTVATIHSWHRRGWIPCLRAGRRPVLFDVAAVEQTLRERAEHRQGVAGEH
jgi:phage terminase Nu1 subunit (DNA packaging protein)